MDRATQRVSFWSLELESSVVSPVLERKGSCHQSHQCVHLLDTVSDGGTFFTLFIFDSLVYLMFFLKTRGFVLAHVSIKTNESSHKILSISFWSFWSFLTKKTLIIFVLLADTQLQIIGFVTIIQKAYGGKLTSSPGPPRSHGAGFSSNNSQCGTIRPT